MEYCQGSDLFTYIEKRGYKLEEKRVCEIIHKLCAAVYYLHSYGIVHRDLKPENIIMTNNSDEADIRLLDFGLSKILGPSEKCSEPFGTISYVAPEVLKQKYYGREVDIWSIGIITYLLLCGCLPFDDEKSEKEIVRQTIEDPVPYYPRIWKKLSSEAKNFVEGCLKKNPEERMNIKDALEHEWIKKFSNLVQLRLQSKKNNDQNDFKIYTTIDNMNISSNK
jgi:serine/threonine protein kinase